LCVLADWILGGARQVRFMRTRIARMLDIAGGEGARMTSAAAGTFDEAYERLHATGPEFDGFLSNHGPVAAEAMVRGGHGDLVDS
jgi:hypothetical protein